MMLSPAADGRLITVVYRHLAKRYPPRPRPLPRGSRRMAELNEAYAVLGDRERRARYDESLGLEAPSSASADDTAAVPSMRSPRQTPAPSTVTPYGEAGPPPSNPGAERLASDLRTLPRLGAQPGRPGRPRLPRVALAHDARPQRTARSSRTCCTIADGPGPGPRGGARRRSGRARPTHGQGLEDAQAEGGADERRAAVGHERQRDAGDGHDPEDHARR